MKQLGIVVLLLAIGAGVAAALYLKATKEKIEEVVQPVAVAAPDLYPPETTVFAAIHRLDEDFNEVQGWWKRFQPTAACYLLEQQWEQNRDTLPPPAQEGLDEFESAMDDAEARFGYRPTTRDFFETYGRYAAFGMVPAASAGERDRLLAVLRLPEGGAPEMLRKSMEETSAVRRHEPPELHGSPVFVEEREPVGAIYYGLGGGFLFVADSADVLAGGLERLARHRAGEPMPSLASDAILKKGAPGSWDSLRAVFYLKRNQNLAEKVPELAVVDQYLDKAFSLAPDDDAVAFSVMEETDGVTHIHSSFPHDEGGSDDWLAVIPAGASQVEMLSNLPQAVVEQARSPAVERFKNKEIWSEISDLMHSPERIRALLTDAVPQEAWPEAAVLERLGHDADFIAAAWDSFIRATMFQSTRSGVYVSKLYDAPGGAVAMEMAIGLHTDPLMLFGAVGTIDLGREQLDQMLAGMHGGPPGPTGAAESMGPASIIRREDRGEKILWILDMDRLRELAADQIPQDALIQFEMAFGQFEPSLLFAGGRAFMFTGKQIREEVIALLDGGGKPIAQDATFTEATRDFGSDYSYLSYRRPSHIMDNQIAQIEGMGILPTSVHPEDEQGQMMVAAFETAKDVFHWSRRIRAQASAMYPGKPGKSVTLSDPEAEARYPSLELPPAAPVVMNRLPASTYGVVSARLDLDPAFDRIRSTFMSQLPGGEEQWRELRVQMEAEMPIDGKELDRFEVDLLRNLKGEVGLAVVRPVVEVDPEAPPGPPNPQDAIDRAPGLVLFMTFADADAAWQLLVETMKNIDAAANPQPFDEQLEAYQNGDVPSPPSGMRMVEQKTPQGHDSVSMDFMLFQQGMDMYLVPSLCLLKREQTIYMTNSVYAWQTISAIPDSGEGSLAARLASELPAGTMPDELCGFAFLQTDGLLDNFRLYIDPLIPMGPSLSLGAYRQEPPSPEKMEEHERGWKRAVDLVDDLFRNNTRDLWFSERSGTRSTTIHHSIEVEGN